MLDWLNEWQHLPDVIHCHDHHTGLIPFLVQYGYKYKRLKDTPTVVTIHNAQSPGAVRMEQAVPYPIVRPVEERHAGLERRHQPAGFGHQMLLAFQHRVSSYMEELFHNANGLEALLSTERVKAGGILNGIDDKVWNPAKDAMIPTRYGLKDAAKGKLANKQALCEAFDLDPGLPPVRVHRPAGGRQRGGLLPEIIGRALADHPGQLNFLVLGSGDAHIEWMLQRTRTYARMNTLTCISVITKRSVTSYARRDYLLMPSRVEPCGLNQMYAMRYGTIPIVRTTGGLIGTLRDFGDEGGTGIRFFTLTRAMCLHAISCALELSTPTKFQRSGRPPCSGTIPGIKQHNSTSIYTPA